MKAMLDVLIIVLALVVLVIAHEFGHFLMAKHYGVEVSEFSIGFGPKLFGTVKNGTAWNFRALLLGGYCAIEEESIFKQSPWHRIAIFIAGPMVNFCLAIISWILMDKLKYGMPLWLAFSRAVSTMFKILPSIGKGLVMSMSVSSNAVTIAESSQKIVTMVQSQTTFINAVIVFLLVAYSENAILFITNIVPIPALDGGQILFTLPELFGKKPDRQIVKRITAVFYFAILGFSVILILKDIGLQIWRMMSPTTFTV